MEFKGLDVSTVDGLRVSQEYTITTAEVSRARVGALLSDKTELLDIIPTHGSTKDSDGFSLRQAAEAVVAGSLALLHNVIVDEGQTRLEAARETVESGLLALEIGAEEAAKRYKAGRS